MAAKIFTSIIPTLANFNNSCYNNFSTLLFWPHSIMVSTTGFHPVNVGSIPAEVTIKIKSLLTLAFLCLYDIIIISTLIVWCVFHKEGI